MSAQAGYIKVENLSEAGSLSDPHLLSMSLVILLGTCTVLVALMTTVLSIIRPT